MNTTTSSQGGSSTPNNCPTQETPASGGATVTMGLTGLCQFYTLILCPTPIYQWLPFAISMSMLITALFVLSCCSPTHESFVTSMQLHLLSLIFILDANILYPLIQPYYPGTASFFVLAIIIWSCSTIFLIPIFSRIVNGSSTVRYDFSTIPTSILLAKIFGFVAEGLRLIADGILCTAAGVAHLANDLVDGILYIAAGVAQLADSLTFLENIVQTSPSGDETQRLTQQNSLASVEDDNNSELPKLTIHDRC